MRVRRSAAVVGLALVVAGLTACNDTEGASSAGSSATGGDGTATATVDPSPTPTVSAAEIAISPADGKGRVRLDKVIRVKADQGQLTKVTVRDDEGTKVAGEIDADGSTWKADEAGLRAAAAYTVSATAVDAQGLETKATSTFKTLKPTERATSYLTPGDDWTVGVGMPIVVSLSEPVDHDNRDAVEEAITVDAQPATTGAWRWFSDSQLQWRPKTFWKSGTTVTVDADLDGVEFSEGTWGKGTSTAAFTVGSRMVSTVDIAEHTLTVRRNGEVIRRIPITTGKSGFETRVGTKVIMSRESSRQMDSETTGIGRDDSEYYNVNVKWAMRLTYSGEFLHAAPWSVGSQGHANVSHGCTGMSTENAKWLFDHSKVGDVVKYVDGSRAMEWGNGYTAWNKTFGQWKSGA